MSTPPPKVREVIEEMGNSEWQRQEMSVNAVRQSLVTTLMKDAWRGSDRSLDEPGTVVQWYNRERQVLVIPMEKEP